MPNPHDAAAVLGGLLSDESFRTQMQNAQQREAVLEAYGFTAVNDSEKIKRIVNDLENLTQAIENINGRCPNWPCPVISRNP